MQTPVEFAKNLSIRAKNFSDLRPPIWKNPALPARHDMNTTTSDSTWARESTAGIIKS